MSAIAGLWRFDNKPDLGADCALMLAAQQIYGPHAGDLWADNALALGRRLFRRLPEDIHDSQPLHCRDGRLTLVADVRIDNRDELIAALRLPQGDAVLTCDAAILLACLEQWGEAALDRIAGDFAFALWNAQTQSLTLARDFRGQVPLHYHRGRAFFAFASMPKGLHALADVPYQANEESISALLAGIPQATSQTCFAGIARVQPAHVVTVTRDGLSSRCYWQPGRAIRTNAKDDAEGLRFHLDQATGSRLRGANGNIGSHLSAGYDSAAVTATAARLLAPGGGKVTAFTAVPRENFDPLGWQNRLADEGPLAAATAALYPNVDHVLIRSGHISPLAGLDRGFHLCDRPILSLPNWVWGQAINEAAQDRNISIVLTGQMGNATLSYRGLELLPELLRQGRLLRLRHEAASLIAHGEMSWRRALSMTLAPFAPHWLRRGQGRRPPANSIEARRAMFHRVDSGTFNKAALAGWGIDLRDPTADKRLVEYCLSLPTDAFLKDGVPRALAKRALADRLPQAVIDEHRKGYQAADWHDGLTAARPAILNELTQLAGCAAASRVLDMTSLQALANNWPASGWDGDDIVRQYRMALLRGIAAGHFLRRTTTDNGGRSHPSDSRPLL